MHCGIAFFIQFSRTFSSGIFAHSCTQINCITPFFLLHICSHSLNSKTDQMQEETVSTYESILLLSHLYTLSTFEVTGPSLLTITLTCLCQCTYIFLLSHYSAKGCSSKTLFGFKDPAGEDISGAAIRRINILFTATESPPAQLAAQTESEGGGDIKWWFSKIVNNSRQQG